MSAIISRPLALEEVPPDGCRHDYREFVQEFIDSGDEARLIDCPAMRKNAASVSQSLKNAIDYKSPGVVLLGADRDEFRGSKRGWALRVLIRGANVYLVREGFQPGKVVRIDVEPGVYVSAGHCPVCGDAHPLADGCTVYVVPGLRGWVHESCLDRALQVVVAEDGQEPPCLP